MGYYNNSNNPSLVNLPPLVDAPSSANSSVQDMPGTENRQPSALDLLARSFSVMPGKSEVFEDVFVTQRAGRMMQSKKLQPKGDGKISSTLLMKKKRELESVQIELDKKRIEVMKRMEEIKEQREGLKTKQKQLKERLAKFEKFLSESSAKRQRALLKAQSERKLRLAKEEEIRQMKDMIVLEVQKKQEIFESINLHRQYEDYLQSVIRILPPNYFNTNEPTINDILLRYKTLHETNMDLVESIEKNQQSVETCQEKLSKMIKENDDQVLVYNAMLGQQQKEYDKIVQDGQIKEQRNDEYHKSVKEKMRILGETKLAIHSLHERVMMIPWLANSQHEKGTIGTNAGANNNASLATGSSLGALDAMDGKLYTIKEKLIDLKNLVDKAMQLNHNKALRRN